MKAKKIKRFSFAIASSFLVTPLGLVGQVVKKQEHCPPNVVLIVTDDQGSIDLNCYGAKDLYTPNLDRLASEGTRLTQFYVGSAICSPSRACLLTGKTPQEAGLTTNAPCEKGRPGMPAEQVTIAEIFKQWGYTTGHIGKWHIGYSPETMPLQQGFDYSFGHMGGCIDNYSHFFYWHGPNRHDLWENGKEVFMDGQYFPEMIVQKATTFIKEKKDSPFFLYIAFNTPHYPLQPIQKWRDYYKDLPSPRREYAGFVSTTDEYIGKILSVLQDENLRRNTIIIFLSDNGNSFEERTGYGGGNSGDFRGGKFSLFEGGIRVPAIISWPKHIPEGKVIDQICLSMDLLPTLLDFCNINSPMSQVEGKSLRPCLLNNTNVHLHQPIFWQLGNQWALRLDNWKLIGNPVDPSPKGKILSEPEDDLFLINLEEDITEMKNLRRQNPEKMMQMLDIYRNWPYANEKNIPVNP